MIKFILGLFALLSVIIIVFLISFSIFSLGWWFWNPKEFREFKRELIEEWKNNHSEE